MVSYYATVLICGADSRLRFAITFDHNVTKRIEVKKADFHTAILKAVLEGFAVPETVYYQLEKILTTIGDNITASRTKGGENQQYWLMLTRYDWQPEIETIQPGKRKKQRPQTPSPREKGIC